MWFCSLPRIPQGESLFDKQPVWFQQNQQNIKYCRCIGGQSIQCDWRERVDPMQDIGKPTIEVNPLKTKYDWDTEDRRRKRSLRMRRDTPTGHQHVDPDSYTDDIDDEEEVFDYGFQPLPGVNFDWPTQSGLTEDFARSYCGRILRNATSYSICSELLTSDVMEPLDRCIDDIKVYVRHC